MKKLDIVIVGGAPLKDYVGRWMVEGGVRLLNHGGGCFLFFVLTSH